jgi:hypothetical protein
MPKMKRRHVANMNRAINSSMRLKPERPRVDFFIAGHLQYFTAFIAWTAPALMIIQKSRPLYGSKE